MTAIWQTLVGRDDPVSGAPHEFAAIEQRFATIKRGMSDLDRSFDAIAGGTADGFKGEAADAFRSKMRAISQAVGDVPLIAGQLEAVFRRHRTELEAIRHRAAVAVNRAQANWSEKCAADGDHSQARRRLATVEDQIEWIEAQGDQADQGEKVFWTRQKIDAQQWVNASRNRIHRAEDAVDGSRDDWRRLYDDEERLDEQTAAALRGTTLWSLADPSFLEQLGKAFGELWDGLKDFAGYIFSTDFLLDLCEILYELLDTLSFVAGIVSLVLVAVGLALSLTVVGAPLGGALLALAAKIHTVSLVMDLVKIGAGAALVRGGRKEQSELMVDVAGLVASFIAGKVVSKLAKPLSMAYLTKTAKFGRIAHLELQSEALSGVGEGLYVGASVGDEVSKGGSNWFADQFTFEFSDQFRGDEATWRFGSKLGSGLRHFDFDPPIRFTPATCAPVRLVPTGW